MADELSALVKRLRDDLATWDHAKIGTTEFTHADARLRSIDRARELFAALTSTQDLLRRAESDLTKVAADCHCSKWEFQEGENERPVVNRVMRKAFDTLHRIGDVANIAARSLSQAIAKKIGTDE